MKSAGTAITHQVVNDKTARASKDGRRYLAMAYGPPDKIKAAAGELFIYISYDPTLAALAKKIVTASGKAYYSSRADAEGRFQLCIRAVNELLNPTDLPVSVGIAAIKDGKALVVNSTGVEAVVVDGDKSSLLSIHEAKSLKDPKAILLNPDDNLFLLDSSNYSRIKKHFTKLSGLTQPGFMKLMLKFAQSNSDGYFSILRIQASSESKESTTNPKSELPGPQKSFGQTIARLSKSLFVRTKHFYTDFKNKYLPAFMSKTKRAWIDFWTKYVNPNPKKAFIIAVITTIIIGIIFFFLVGNIRTASSPLSKLEEAKILLDSAFDAQKNNNNISAKEYSDKASGLLKQISATDQKKLDAEFKQKSSKYSYSEQASRLGQLTDLLQSVTRIQPSGSFDIAVKDLTAMAYFSSGLYAINKQAGNIIQINPLFGTPTVKASSNDLKSASSAAVFTENSLMILTSGGVLQYDGAASLTKQNAQSLPSATAIATYLNNVYLLSPSDNQVIRYTKSGSNLLSRTQMLKNIPANRLSGTDSMVVFGNIFIPKNKSILLFEQGEERNFRINGLPESFGEIKTIVYNPDGNYFLVLNSKSDKLAQLSLDAESANFKKSFALQDDSTISSFAIDNKTSQVFVNSGTKIISFNLEK